MDNNFWKNDQIYHSFNIVAVEVVPIEAHKVADLACHAFHVNLRNCRACNQSGVAHLIDPTMPFVNQLEDTLQ